MGVLDSRVIVVEFHLSVYLVAGVALNLIVELKLMLVVFFVFFTFFKRR